MKKTSILIPLLFLASLINAQSIVGKWETIDDETGKAKSIVEIYKKGDQYFGKIVEIINPAKRRNICKLCTDSRKNQPILGMEIIKNLKKDDDEYNDGTILDPNNGKVYDCKIWLKDKTHLNVRGYIMFFFRTQTWIKL